MVYGLGLRVWGFPAPARALALAAAAAAAPRRALCPMPRFYTGPCLLGAKKECTLFDQKNSQSDSSQLSLLILSKAVYWL